MMEVKFARNESVAEVITRLLRGASGSIDAAMYRVNHPRLVEVLDEAVGRGLRVRLLVDGNKYEESRATQELLARARIPFHLAYGRRGLGTKMHHKFVILDRQTVLTGSYNWTLESESENHENLLVLQEEQPVAAYAREFESLWNGTAGDDA
jgi:phosphatidylserine/phosphatidylglycerophosphate/cardiolipin synthase-like enzyme